MREGEKEREKEREKKREGERERERESYTKIIDNYIAVFVLQLLKERVYKPRHIENPIVDVCRDVDVC